MKLYKEIVNWITRVIQNWRSASQERQREAQYRGCWQLQQSAWGYRSQADREETKKWK